MIRIEIVKDGNAHLPVIRELFTAYANELGEDLTFQQFNTELQDPFAKYGPPAGCLIIAYKNDDPAGCIALHQIDTTTCEMKRMFVKPEFRGQGIGDTLVSAILQSAQQKGYKRMVLDTLDRLQAAIYLYKRYGFFETSAYYANPLPGVVYMELSLTINPQKEQD